MSGTGINELVKKETKEQNTSRNKNNINRNRVKKKTGRKRQGRTGDKKDKEEGASIKGGKE